MFAAKYPHKTFGGKNFKNFLDRLLLFTSLFCKSLLGISPQKITQNFWRALHSFRLVYFLCLLSSCHSPNMLLLFKLQTLRANKTVMNDYCKN